MNIEHYKAASERTDESERLLTSPIRHTPPERSGLSKMIADQERLKSRIIVLEGMLAEAWETGADHRKASFQQLGRWRKALTTDRITPANPTNTPKGFEVTPCIHKAE